MINLSAVSVKASKAPAGTIVGVLTLYNESVQPLPAHFILNAGAVGVFGLSSNGTIVTMTANLPVGFYGVTVTAVAQATEFWSEEGAFVIQVQ